MGRVTAPAANHRHADHGPGTAPGPHHRAGRKVKARNPPVVPRHKRAPLCRSERGGGELGEVNIISKGEKNKKRCEKKQGALFSIPARPSRLWQTYRRRVARG